MSKMHTYQNGDRVWTLAEMVKNGLVIKGKSIDPRKRSLVHNITAEGQNYLTANERLS